MARALLRFTWVRGQQAIHLKHSSLLQAVRKLIQIFIGWTARPQESAVPCLPDLVAVVTGPWGAGSRAWLFLRFRGIRPPFPCLFAECGEAFPVRVNRLPPVRGD